MHETQVNQATATYDKTTKEQLDGVKAQVKGLPDQIQQAWNTVDDLRGNAVASDTLKAAARNLPRPGTRTGKRPKRTRPRRPPRSPREKNSLMRRQSSI